MNQEQTEQVGITIPEIPFGITFSYGNKSINISIVKGNDIFKIAELFKNMLGKHEIEYNIKITENK
jgi:hypothetical protein